MKFRLSIILSSIILLMTSACSKGTSYAELLGLEEKAVNHYLANFRVEKSMPVDNKFEVGEDAPFYRVDSEGTIYMQVLSMGDQENNMAKTGDKIYFRYNRSDLIELMQTGETTAIGNEADMTYSQYFIFNNYRVESSATFGSGIQTPLLYLGIDCEVNLLVRSQYGFTREVATVVPYLFHLRYVKSKI